MSKALIVVVVIVAILLLGVLFFGIRKREEYPGQQERGGKGSVVAS